ncbi:MAG: UTP--glucose-1-phosphate uridylyltransferase [Thermoproteota archaeon]
MEIKKAVIPIAGKGTRFLPATKQISKEIIPILNVPMIQYVVEEVISAGIEEIIFITSEGKEELEQYFKRNYKLEKFLEENNKLKELELIQKIGSMAEFRTVTQKEQLGLGHAVLMAKSEIQEDLFAVVLGDDLCLNEKPVIKQLMDVSKEYDNASVIGVMEVERKQTQKYGIISGKHINEKTLIMDKMVEKPKPELAPTNLATPGRYVLNTEIFNILEKSEKGVGGEIQLTDAINKLCESEKVLAHIFTGDRFDTGNIRGYLDATIEFALRDPNLRQYTLELLNKKIKENK